MALPLEGLKVLDLSRVLAGPFATQILGDLGASVLKIEPPEGDSTRQWAPPYFEDESVYFLSANRNKQTLRLDFHNPTHLQKLKQWAQQADVVVENFKVGGLKKFGLDYSSLAAQNPRLIYCSITGFGQSGPQAQQPGYDALIQAMAGLMSITGPDSLHPSKVGVAITDISTGLYAVIGLLSALRYRDQTGQGQHLDLSLLESQTSILSHIAMNFLVTGEAPQPRGNSHPNIVPYESFTTQDKSLFLAIGNDRQFANFCKLLNKSWHLESEFCTNPQRVTHRATLIPLIQEELNKYPRSYWLQQCDQALIPCAPINDLADLTQEPQVKARQIFTKMQDQKTPCIKSPLNFSHTPIVKYSPPQERDAEDSIVGWELKA